MNPIDAWTFSFLFLYVFVCQCFQEFASGWTRFHGSNATLHLSQVPRREYESCVLPWHIKRGSWTTQSMLIRSFFPLTGEPCPVRREHLGHRKQKPNQNNTKQSGAARSKPHKNHIWLIQRLCYSTERTKTAMTCIVKWCLSTVQAALYCWLNVLLLNEPACDVRKHGSHQ